MRSILTSYLWPKEHSLFSTVTLEEAGTAFSQQVMNICPNQAHGNVRDGQTGGALIGSRVLHIRS